MVLSWRGTMLNKIYATFLYHIPMLQLKEENWTEAEDHWQVHRNKRTLQDKFSQLHCWRFRCTGCNAVLLAEQFQTFWMVAVLWYAGQTEPKTLLLESLDPADDSTTISRNVANYSPNDTVSHRGRLVSPSKLFWITILGRKVLLEACPTGLKYHIKMHH